MTERDPRTVFVAENLQLAEAVVQLLAGKNIPAEITRQSAPDSSALTGLMESPMEDFPILVENPAQAEEARELLANAEKLAHVQAASSKRATRTGTTTAMCEDCGKTSEWPASAMGTTETCPHCANYMDIPDPDENWSDLDFGDPEEEETEEKAE